MSVWPEYRKGLGDILQGSGQLPGIWSLPSSQQTAVNDNDAPTAQVQPDIVYSLAWRCTHLINLRGA